jgi:ABC-type antimicrobial peptide transport system permease subunit
MLAVFGLYGVIAMSAQARRRELGVRLALGATPAALSRLVLGEGLRLVGLGIVVGLAAALSVAGALQSLLFGVSARDLAVFATATAVVISVALVASYVPARRAGRGNPSEALRAE